MRNTERDYTEAVEATMIIGELLQRPLPDWERIGALAERIQRIADERSGT